MIGQQLPGEMATPASRATEYLTVTKECRDFIKPLSEEWNCSMGDIVERVAYTVKACIDHREVTGEGLTSSVIQAINKEYLENGRGDTDTRRVTIYSNKAVVNILKTARKMSRLTTSQLIMLLAPMMRTQLVFDDVSRLAYEELKTDRYGVTRTEAYLTARAVYFDMANIMFKKLLHDMLQDHATSLTAGQVKEVEDYVDQRIPMTRVHEFKTGKPMTFDFMGEK